MTSPDEAQQAAAAGADALIVQGVEAGRHRGVFVDTDDQSDLTLLAALQLIAGARRAAPGRRGRDRNGRRRRRGAGGRSGAPRRSARPTCAHGRRERHAQREATATATRTVLTRAFSGRLARGLTNRMHEEYGALAPRAYPEVHHLTVPLRAYGRRVGDPDLINLWAGQTHSLAQARSAEEITSRLAQDARDAIALWAERLHISPAPQSSPAPHPAT